MMQFREEAGMGLQTELYPVGIFDDQPAHYGFDPEEGVAGKPVRASETVVRRPDHSLHRPLLCFPYVLELSLEALCIRFAGYHHIRAAVVAEFAGGKAMMFVLKEQFPRYVLVAAVVLPYLVYEHYPVRRIAEQTVLMSPC